MKKHIFLPITLLLPLTLHGGDKKTPAPVITTLAKPSAQPVTDAGKAAVIAAASAANAHAAPIKKSTSIENLSKQLAATKLSTTAAPTTAPATTSTSDTKSATTTVLASPAVVPAKPAPTWQWSLNPLTAFGYFDGAPTEPSVMGASDKLTASTPSSGGGAPALERQTTQS